METNSFSSYKFKPSYALDLEEPFSVEKAGPFGCFELGSTVIVVVNSEIKKGNPELFQKYLDQPVKMGQSL